MNNPSILIIGSNGHWFDMVMLSKQAGFNVSEIDFPQIDITDPSMTERCIIDFKPDYIINCAAYTAVDDCETHQKTAFAVNAQGAQNIAISAKKAGAVMVHISTIMFLTEKDSPYLSRIKLPHLQCMANQNWKVKDLLPLTAKISDFSYRLAIWYLWEQFREDN